MRRTDRPRTLFTTAVDGVHIAYQVAGDGDVDVVLLQDWMYPLEDRWDEPVFAAPTQRLASFCRLLCFDRRGMGLSDPVAQFDLSTIEHWFTDMHAAMNAAGFERAVIVGVNEGSQVAQLFAATAPERTEALVLVNGTARLCRDVLSNYPGVARELLLEQLASTESWWGGATAFRMAAPSLAEDRDAMRRLARILRHHGAIGSTQALLRVLIDLDTRAILPTIQAPSLVVQRSGDTQVPVEQGRFLAANIPNATHAELPGIDHAWWAGDYDGIVDEIEQFVTGTRPPVATDRVLATVVFTDIVDSTRRAHELGDQRWRHLLDAHDSLVDKIVQQHRGRVVNTTGDGCVAVFDGPGRAVLCSRAICDAAAELGLSVRVGVHTGEIEQRGDDIAGVAVHTAARVGALATPGAVFVSRTVVDLVAGSSLRFEDRGEHALKGVPGTWHLFAALPRAST